MSIMSLPYAKPIAAITAVGLVLGVSAGIAERFRKPSPPEIRTERKSETRTTAENEATSELVAMVRQLQTQNQTLTAQLQQSMRNEQSGETRTVERIEKYLPGPVSAAPATPVVVVGGQPQPVTAGVTGPQLAEVVTRTIEAVTRSKSETDTTKTETAKVETKSETEANSTEKKTETAKVETTEKTTEKTTIKPGDVPELPRFGAGYTSTRQPFVSYDLTRGPRILGLDRVGAGVFVTKASAGGLDGGPQLNLSLPKGKRLQPFVMGGYAVREQKTLIGVGVRF